jgi:hypothetical protein
MINHHGRYIQLSLDTSPPIPMNTPTGLVLIALDRTIEIREKEQKEQAENSTTNRLKNKF